MNKTVFLIIRRRINIISSTCTESLTSSQPTNRTRAKNGRYNIILYILQLGTYINMRPDNKTIIIIYQKYNIFCSTSTIIIIIIIMITIIIIII